MTNVVDIYTAGDEDSRMAADRNQVEWIRTCELLNRWLPSAPASIIDAGGGPGRYARHLLDRGYAVRLYDVVPLHVQQATARGVQAQLADARNMPESDATADAVLLLGPLYHLPISADREQALAEAVRVVQPGGVVIAAALSRWARVFVRAAADQLADQEWHQLSRQKPCPGASVLRLVAFPCVVIWMILSLYAHRLRHHRSERRIRCHSYDPSNLLDRRFPSSLQRVDDGRLDARELLGEFEGDGLSDKVPAGG